MYKLFDYNPVSASTADGYYYYPVHTTELKPWNAPDDAVDLTIPDLGDSIEQMLARRAAGLPEAPTAVMRTVRDYPVDPSTVRSAVDTLKSIQADAKTELDEIKSDMSNRAKLAAETKALQEKQQAEFKAWQAMQKTV